ncbi:unnamed protein product [Leptosia nina]|uniref:Uncharacterized protein n=1 Tax=Leptosia nina TaxID=320188 RepID=A0AAV1JCZ4_9NEOP
MGLSIESTNIKRHYDFTILTCQLFLLLFFDLRLLFSSSLEDDDWCGASKKSAGYLMEDGRFVRLALAMASTTNLSEILDSGSTGKGATPLDGVELLLLMYPETCNFALC